MSDTARDNMWIWVSIVLIICVIIYYLRKTIHGEPYEQMDRINAKVVIVTGANSRIGKQTALELAKRGAKVYMACRDIKKCEKIRLEIIDQTMNHNVFGIELDLASMNSIREFVKTFMELESRLDVLINNAAVMEVPTRTLSMEGFELNFAVNHLGHFYLTHLLLDQLKLSAPSRIVIVSCSSYRFGQINKDDLNSERSYNKNNAYFQSKLANILFMNGLFKRLQDTQVTVNSVHPGVVRKPIEGKVHPIILAFNKVLDYFMKSPEVASQTIVKLTADPNLEKITGKYFCDCIEKELLPKAKDDETSEWLWKMSEELTGLGYYQNVVKDSNVELNERRLSIKSYV